MTVCIYRYIHTTTLYYYPYTYFLLQDTIELATINCHELGKKCAMFALLICLNSWDVIWWIHLSPTSASVVPP